MSKRQIQTTDCRYKVTIEKEAFLTMRLCLVAVPGTRKEDITRMISDPSSLDQCDQYLQSFPGLRKEAAADAAQAAQAVAGSNERWTPLNALEIAHNFLPSTVLLEAFLMNGETG